MFPSTKIWSSIDDIPKNHLPNKHKRPQSVKGPVKEIFTIASWPRQPVYKKTGSWTGFFIPMLSIWTGFSQGRIIDRKTEYG